MLSLYIPFLKNIFNTAKKIFLVVAVFFVIINLFLYFIQKDKVKLQTADPIKKNRDEIYRVINDPKLNETKEGKLSVSIYKLMMCGMIGEACTNNPDDGDKNYKNSLVGFMTNLIVLPYANPPASGVFWVYDGLQNAGFIPKSYAAEGIGFAAIKPFANLWKVFRDLSYMLLVLVLVAIGFMIMFRMKLNPQTVISIESALPKIVVSLLMITFSFAIAGFLIDLMYVIIVIGISTISTADPKINPMHLQNKYLTGSLGTLWDSFFTKQNDIPILGGFATLITTGDALMSIFPKFLNDIIRTIAWVVVGWPVIKIGLDMAHGARLQDVLSNLSVFGVSLGKGPEAVIGTIVVVALLIIAGIFVVLYGGGFILGMLVFFTMLLILFRIFFLLFRSYLQILLMVIFAPIFLLFEAIPGKNAFSYWFKNLFGEILTFPLIIMFFIIGSILVNTFSSSSNIWSPPFLYGIDANSFGVFLGMGLLFLIPDLVKLVKEFMGIKPLPISVGLNTFFAGGAAALGGGMGLAGSFSSLSLALPGVRKIVGKVAGNIGGTSVGKFFNENYETTLKSGAPSIQSDEKGNPQAGSPK